MNSRISIALGTIALLCAGLPRAAVAQTAKDLVGSWTVISVDNVSPDGARTPAFGPNPKGIVIFGDDGRYAELIMRSDLPKIAAANRAQGTPDENKAIVQGTLAFFGPYSVTGNVVTLAVEGSNYPNWTGGDQKRTVTAFTHDQMTWTNSSGSGGGLVELVAKRVK
jgi:Lipocalin-like domain